MQPLHDMERTRLAQLKRSPDDFDCIPIVYQIEYFVEMLWQRGDHSFSADEVTRLFAIADMTNPRTHKAVKPTPRLIDQKIDQLSTPLRYARMPDGGYTLPWKGIGQVWSLVMLARGAEKARKIAGQLAAGFGEEPLETRADPVSEGRYKVHFMTALPVIAEPCAVAEAIRRAEFVSKSWTISGSGVAIKATSERVAHPAVELAEWNLAALPADADAEGEADAQEGP